MVTGNSIQITFGQEDEYGTYAAQKQRLAVSSEGLKYVRNATEEGLLLGSAFKTGLTECMSQHTEGDFATLAKPKTIGYIMGGLMGKETVADSADENSKFKHTFTAIGNKETDHLPSWSFTIDRGVSTQSYTGVKFGSCSFSAAAEDRLQVSLTVVGKDEIQNGVIDPTLKPESSKSFKFHQAKIKIDNEEVASVTSVSVEYNNNIDNSIYTTQSGLYSLEPECSGRECTAQLEAIYTSDTEKLRNEKFKTDSLISVEIEFKDADNNRLVWKMPHAQITEMEGVTVGGDEVLKQSLTVSAVDLLDGEAVVVELYNDYPDGYLADATVIETTGSGD